MAVSTVVGTGHDRNTAESAVFRPAVITVIIAVYHNTVWEHRRIGGVPPTSSSSPVHSLGCEFHGSGSNFTLQTSSLQSAGVHFDNTGFRLHAPGHV